MAIEPSHDPVAPPDPIDDLKDPQGSRRSWRDWYLVAVVIGFVGYCLGPSLIGLRTLLSVNMLTAYYPWIAIHGLDTAGHEGCTGDTIDTVMPGIAQVRTQLFHGQLASWQSLVAGGGPLSSVPNLGLLDPLSLPYFVLPLWMAPAFVILLSFIAAVGGSFLFLRRLTLSRPAALLAGLIFSTSGFMVMWTNWPQTRVAALIPALFWAVERLIQRARLVDTALIAVVIASMVFGGFPVITGYAIYLASAYLIVRLIMIHRSDIAASVRAIGLAGLGLVLGFLLTAVQLLPFLYFFRNGDLTYRTGQALSGLPFWSLVTLIAPKAVGLCVGGSTATGVNTVETVAYIGAAAIVLAVTGAAFGPGGRWPRGRGVRAFFVVAVVVVLALGWGLVQFREVTESLPIFADNFIGRIRSVLGFALAVLAAVGFDWVTLGRNHRAPADSSATSPEARRRHRLWGALVCVVSAVTGLLILLRARDSPVAGDSWSRWGHALWIPLVLTVAAVLLVVGARIRPSPGRMVAFIVLPLLVAGQGAQFFHTVLPGDPKSDFYPRTGTYEFLAHHLGDDRFASSGLTMYPATSLYYGIRTPTGHFFYQKSWVDLLKAVDPKVMSSPTFADFTPAINQSNAGQQPILDEMGVKYFVLPPGDVAGNPQPMPAVDGSTIVRGTPATCTLAGQPLWGVTVYLTRALIPTVLTRGFTIHLAVHDGGHTITSGRYVQGVIPSGAGVSIALAGGSLPVGGHVSVAVSETGVRGGMALATSHGAVACAAVTPVADGLSVAYADAGSIIYQRLTAEPRIRWASRSLIIPDGHQQVTALSRGVPPATVALNSGVASGSGRAGSVTVLDDSGDLIAARVDAAGSGFLVVGDAMQQSGWKVTVDGRAAKLLPADHAMVAVAVPAGVHDISFSYRAPDEAKGLVVSVLAGVAVLAIVVVEFRRRRRGRRRPRHRAGAVSPPDTGVSSSTVPPVGD
jgi:hypothetical protein